MKSINVVYTKDWGEVVIVRDEAGQPLNEGFCHQCENFPDDIELNERCGDCIADYYSDMEDFRAEMQTDNFSGDY